MATKDEAGRNLNIDYSGHGRIYDVIVVGAGPAGLFCAHTLVHSGRNFRIALVDKGKNVAPRVRDARNTEDRAQLAGEELVSGAGGAGLFSDGKLVLSLKAGGKLSLSPEEEKRLVRHVDSVLHGFDGRSVVVESSAGARSTEHLNEVKFKPIPVRHFATENLPSTVQRFLSDLELSNSCEFMFERRVVSVRRSRDLLLIQVEAANGVTSTLVGKAIVFAVGKEGSPWLAGTLGKLGVGNQKNRTYFGVRVETTPTKILSGYSGDPKFFSHFPDGSKIKTHCFCSRGQVLPLRYFGLPLAGAHSPFNLSAQSCASGLQSTFAVLLSDTIETPFTWEMCISYMQKVAEVTDGRLLVQRFGDFRARRASSYQDLAHNSVKPSVPEYVPGDISALALPLGYSQKFLQFAEELNRIEPGLIHDDSLLYAPAVEWWMPKIEVDENLQTCIPGVYAVGDGAGQSQGIMYAAATGIIAAESIVKEIKHNLS